MFRSAVLTAAFVLVSVAAAQAAPSLHLVADKVVVQDGEKSATLEVEVNAVGDAAGIPIPGLRFSGISEETGRQYGLRTGLYLFDEQGKMTAMIPFVDAEICAEIRFSPGRQILAADAGTWVVRSWSFFRYPALKPLGTITYYQRDDNPELLWQGDSGVFFSSIEMDKHKRECGYDPCGPVSVHAYSFRSKKTTTVLAGTNLCDFNLTGLSAGQTMIEASQLCTSSIKAWYDFPEDVPLKTVSARIPRP